MRTRKQYTKEFKLDAVNLVLDQEYPITEAARSLEINANMLRRWIKKYQADDGGQLFRGNEKLTPEQEEIRRLKARIKQFNLERKILEEAAGDSMGEGNEVKYSFFTQKKKKTCPVGLGCQLISTAFILGIKSPTQYEAETEKLEKVA